MSASCLKCQQNLVENEVFKSTLISATLEAGKTHREETLKALRNAVLNSALPDAPDDYRQKMFVQWISELTPWHVKLLMLFATPGIELPSLPLDNPDWRQNYELGQLGDVIEQTYPEMKGDFHLYVQMIHDLYQKGFIVHQIPEKGIAAQIKRSPTPTPVAKEFLDFIIKSPLEKPPTK